MLPRLKVDSCTLFVFYGHATITIVTHEKQQLRKIFKYFHIFVPTNPHFTM